MEGMKEKMKAPKAGGGCVVVHRAPAGLFLDPAASVGLAFAPIRSYTRLETHVAEEQMRIDWHVHINDPKYAGPPWWRHPVPMSLENALEAHRLAGLDPTLISHAGHSIRFCEAPAT